MEFGAVFEIICAMFTIVGVFCLAKYISEVFFLPREILTAIKIFDDGARDNADILLHIAKKGMWRSIGKETCVLISEKYAQDEELLSLIRESGLEYYIIV